ncbi:unnamed protein product [Protopolystoma xenopodis]|uniref:Cadherin domain-containing protein n=1 Tax=Protopolystoma xenopodis TaxID=117903 RepID=A0A3S5CNF7_9PLAT|nr:unnamed protein product [Protopolystoma xenopodis]
MFSYISSFALSLYQNGEVISSEPVTSNSSGPDRVSAGHVRIGRLAIWDADSPPNAGPFTCQLMQSGGSSIAAGGGATNLIGSTGGSGGGSMHSPFTGASLSSSASLGTGSGIGGTGLFSIRNFSEQHQTTGGSANDQPISSIFQEARVDAGHSGSCYLYAIDRLPVGSQTLMVRVNDNGLTALHTTTTVTIHVVRQSNLPPEIVRGNATLTYFAGISRFGSLHESESHYSYSSTGFSPAPPPPIARVTVKDRTAYDRLVFELVPGSPGTQLFRVDRYDGSIRPAIPGGSVAGVSRKGAVSGFDWHDIGTDGGSRPSASRGGVDNEILDDSLDRSYKAGSSINSFSLDMWRSLTRLDSGIYPLRIRVSNGSLSSEETIFIRVSAITEEMIEASSVIRIANLMPNLFYMEAYDLRLKQILAAHLLATSPPPSSASVESLIDNVFLLSIQEAYITTTSSTNKTASGISHSSYGQIRKQRSLDTAAVDVLVAIYRPDVNAFVPPVQVAQAVRRLADHLEAEFGGRVEPLTDTCPSQYLVPHAFPY